MQLISIKVCVRLVLMQVLIVSTICLYTWMPTYLFKSSEPLPTLQASIKSINATAMAYSTRPPIVINCSQKYKVAFTFDDGPHPIYTPLIIQTLHRHKVKAGFFLLGTSLQSFLSAHNNLSAHIFERPRIGFLLLQDYSLVERLLDGHDIYLHGWLHEKNTEMYLQTMVDNIATQLLEIGVLKGFKPVYRAPWGIGTAPGHTKKRALLPQILNQMGIIPALWNVDTKDYVIKVDENKLIDNTLKVICRAKGGHILMHDNQPTTAYFLDRIIRSIKASGHTIVSPGDIDRMWTDPIRVNRTRKYTQLLRERARKIQRNGRLLKTIVYRPVEVFITTHQVPVNFSNCIDPIVRYEGSLKVTPNINNV
jgi:peptidoglycan/xylan/chitin deacetylase (PgdA/CDA1 family)